MLHEALSGRRLTKLEYLHELPRLQDKLLDAQFELRKSRSRSVAVIVTGIPGAGAEDGQPGLYPAQHQPERVDQQAQFPERAQLDERRKMAGGPELGPQACA